MRSAILRCRSKADSLESKQLNSATGIRKVDESFYLSYPMIFNNINFYFYACSKNAGKLTRYAKQYI